MEIKKILCSTDFSETSIKAIGYAEKIALENNATLHLVNVNYNFYGLDGFEGSPLSPSEIQREIQQTTQENIANITAKISPKVILNTVILQGNVAKEIVKAALYLDCDMIVIASNGRKGLKHMLFGSVAESVSRSAHCPVLIIK